jgi:hypothetical protein
MGLSAETAAPLAAEAASAATGHTPVPGTSAAGDDAKRS